MLGDQPEWTSQNIFAATHSGTEHAVKPTSPLPVYPDYFTAWEQGGVLKAATDVYGLDRRHPAATGQRRAQRWPASSPPC